MVTAASIHAPAGSSDSPDSPDSTRSRLLQAFASYESGEVVLRGRSLAGATHLVASRKGLFAVNDREWSQIASGFYFGLTVRGDEIFAFEACDQPHSPLRRGRIVRLEREGDNIARASVVVKGLDNGCHQIDFCRGRLHVVDTYNQQVVRLAPGETSPEDESQGETSPAETGSELLLPLPTPPQGRWANTDPRYVHANSLLAVGETNLLLLHNSFEHTGRCSEVALYDTGWQPLEPVARWALPGRSCHGLALLEDGTLLTCDSGSGDLISAQGLRVPISPDFTRGLAVGADTIAVGACRKAPRERRAESTGTVTFLDRDFRRRAVLAIPGGPTEIRRLDGQDAGLSSYLERVPWGRTLQAGTPIA